MAAIVDFDERTLAFKAVAAAFCHTGLIAMGRRLRLSYPFDNPRLLAVGGNSMPHSTRTSL